MSVDKRYASRFSTSADVTVWNEYLGFLKGRMRNVSASGMFIEFEDVPFPDDGNIGVSLVINNDVRRLSGMVVHSDTRGVGIEFFEPQPDLRLSFGAY